MACNLTYLIPASHRLCSPKLSPNVGTFFFLLSCFLVILDLAKIVKSSIVVKITFCWICCFLRLRYTLDLWYLFWVLLCYFILVASWKWNSHLFFFGFWMIVFLWRWVFVLLPKAFIQSLNYLKFLAMFLGLCCHELLLGAGSGGKGNNFIHYFLLLLNLFIFILVLVESL